MTTSTNPNPLGLGSGFRVCSFLVNVLSYMYQQWKDAGSPTDPSKFNWKPTNVCPLTTDFDTGDYDFGQLIWSKYTWLDKPRIEPFGALVKSKASADLYYLVFRGSKTVADFCVDTEAGLVSYTAPTPNPPPGIQVARGWYKVYTGMADLQDRLSGIYPGYLIITGHSLGSTLATLAVPDAVAKKFHVSHYNSASPKVGNAAFRTYYLSLTKSSPGMLIDTYRLVNTADSVPDFPGSLLHPDYVHVGTSLNFYADYGSEENNHNPCCTYSYALIDPSNPFNPTFDKCNAPPPLG